MGWRRGSCAPRGRGEGGRGHCRAGVAERLRLAGRLGGARRVPGDGGLSWSLLVENYVVRSQDLIIDPYAAMRMRFVDHLLAPWFGNLTVMLLVVCPAVAMRTFAEEVRSETLRCWRRAGVRVADRAREIPGGAGLRAGRVGEHGVDAGVVGALVGRRRRRRARRVPGDRFAGGGVGGAGGPHLRRDGAAGPRGDRRVLGDVGAVDLGWLDEDPTSWSSQASPATHLHDLIRGRLRVSDVGYFVVFAGWCLFATWQRIQAWRVA